MFSTRRGRADPSRLCEQISSTGVEAYCNSNHSAGLARITRREGAVLDAVCAWKLGSLAFKLLAGASKALDYESVATFLEIGANSMEAGEALHDRQRDVVRAAAAHCPSCGRAGPS
jgi:hypothetical protein